MSEYEQIINELHRLSRPESKAGMAQYGIQVDKALGISIPELRNIARRVGKNHELALRLWDSEWHEARILATMIADPEQLSETLTEKWAMDLNSWDLCDQFCNNLLRKTAFAHRKALEWSGRPEEFVKRAGFVLMAVLAVHDKKSKDPVFTNFFPLIEREAFDNRNFVKKAVNWALRQIGKRNAALNREAIRTAQKIAKRENPAGRWIAQDALRELLSEPVQKKFQTGGGCL
ncbi:MAG: DNA alkylation repair protein [Calditrichia bacterium]